MGISDDLLDLMESFLSERFQRVLCYSQSCEWASIKADVPKGSILDPLLFWIYINDLSDAIHDINSSASNVNFDLWKISELDFKWKIKFF